MISRVESEKWKVEGRNAREMYAIVSLQRHFHFWKLAKHSLTKYAASLWGEILITKELDSLGLWRPFRSTAQLLLDSAGRLCEYTGRRIFIKSVGVSRLVSVETFEKNVTERIQSLQKFCNPRAMFAGCYLSDPPFCISGQCI